MNTGHRETRNMVDRRAFTLLELLVVISIILVLASLIFVAYGKALVTAKRIACVSNLRQVNTAFMMYLHDSNGQFFEYRRSVPEGTLWYWGLETGGGAEGQRVLDKSRAVLAEYFDHVGGVEICPAFSYQDPIVKQKFNVPSYGYALNGNMLRGLTIDAGPRVETVDLVSHPAQTITWADSAQVNTWQPPASAANPMLEEWYYLNVKPPPKHHFRHGGLCNAAFLDGSVRSLRPHSLLSLADGRTGNLEPPGRCYYLRMIK